MRLAVVFSAYCGMSYDLATNLDDQQSARKVVARYIRQQRRKGRTIVTLKHGRNWETLEPEDCMIVPDDAGTFAIVDRTRYVKCWHCGDDVEVGEFCESCTEG